MINVVCGDITTLDTDAIVNAANERLRGGGGVDGAIHRAAGPDLLAELMQFPSCPTGGAVVTRGYRLTARWVIHAVGPVWNGGRADEARLLDSAYERSFELARGRREIRTIAFPAISTGVYRFPREEAAVIAIAAMRRHEDAFDEIIACLYDEQHAELYRALL